MNSMKEVSDSEVTELYLPKNLVLCQCTCQMNSEHACSFEYSEFSFIPQMPRDVQLVRKDKKQAHLILDGFEFAF